MFSDFYALQKFEKVKGAGFLQGSGQSKEELCANDTSHDPNWTKIAPND